MRGSDTHTHCLVCTIHNTIIWKSDLLFCSRRKNEIENEKKYLCLKRCLPSTSYYYHFVDATPTLLGHIWCEPSVRLAQTWVHSVHTKEKEKNNNFFVVFSLVRFCNGAANANRYCRSKLIPAANKTFVQMDGIQRNGGNGTYHHAAWSFSISIFPSFVIIRFNFMWALTHSIPIANSFLSSSSSSSSCGPGAVRVWLWLNRRLAHRTTSVEFIKCKTWIDMQCQFIHNYTYSYN